MAGVPQSILEVKRPEDTAVFNTNSGTNFSYIVRRKATAEELAVKPSARYKEVVGHIIDGVFVPVETREESEPENPIDVRFGFSIFVLWASLNFFEKLKKVFPVKDAINIITIACLKVLYPGVTEQTVSLRYRNDYISIFYPGASVSKNSVANIYRSVGKNNKCRRAFYKLMLDEIAEKDIIYVDGSLYQDTSTVNSLSASSYKRRQQNHDVVSVISGLSDQTDHFCCEEVVPGSFSDASALKVFLVNNNIKKGIICTDGGFRASTIRKLIAEEGLTELHYIVPMMRNDVRIKKYDLLTVGKVFQARNGLVMHKKVKMSDNQFLYSFKNASIESVQRQHALEKLLEGEITEEEYFAAEPYFGFVFVETDIDADSQFVYKTILRRWKIEVLFQFKKRDLDMDKTRVHEDASVIGQEFIDLIASNINTEAFKHLKSKGLLEKTTFKDIKSHLEYSSRKVSPEEKEAMCADRRWIFNEGKPLSHDESWLHTTQKNFSILEDIGFCIKDESQDSTRNTSKIKVDKQKDDDTLPKFEPVYTFLKSLIPSHRKLNSFSEKNMSKLSVLLSTIAILMGCIGDGTIENLSQHSKPSEENTTEEDKKQKTEKRGRKKGGLNKKTIEKQLAFERLAFSFKSIKDGCLQAVAELNTLESLSKGGRKGGEQEATQRKQGVPAGTKRPDFNKDGTPRQKPGPKPNSEHKEDESCANSEQTTTADKPESLYASNGSSEASAEGGATGSAATESTADAAAKQSVADSGETSLKSAYASDGSAEASAEGGATGSAAAESTADAAAKQSVADSGETSLKSAYASDVSMEASTDASPSGSAEAESSNADATKQFQDANAPVSRDGKADEQKAASKKRGVPVGTKRPDFNKDGAPRQKPGPKPGSHRKKRASKTESVQTAADERDRADSPSVSDASSEASKNSGESGPVATENSSAGITKPI